MKLATALVASILSLTALDTRAAAPDETYSTTIQFADLDLNRQAGIAKLYLRIKGAARRVCDYQANDHLGAKQAYPVCVKDAVSTAVARINHPLLSDYFAQVGGKPAKTVSVAAR